MCNIEKRKQLLVVTAVEGGSMSHWVRVHIRVAHMLLSSWLYFSWMNNDTVTKVICSLFIWGCICLTLRPTTIKWFYCVYTQTHTHGKRIKRGSTETSLRLYKSNPKSPVYQLTKLLRLSVHLDRFQPCIMGLRRRRTCFRFQVPDANALCLVCVRSLARTMNISPWMINAEHEHLGTQNVNCKISNLHEFLFLVTVKQT